MSDESIFVNFFGNTPIVRIIDFFLDNRMFDYSKKQVAEGAGISKGALFKYWKILEESEIVKNTRSFGKAKLYKLDESNVIVQRILKLELDLIKHFAEFDTRKGRQKITA